MQKRDSSIDILRAVAVLVMILTHSLVPYLSQPHLYKLWDIIHFAVPMFVFCSGYLFFCAIDKHNTNSGMYILKRIYRLLLPFYVYAIFYTAFMIWAGKLSLSYSYVVSVLTATGGIDIGWLVLLFLFFTALTPLYTYIYRSVKVRWIYSALAIISCIVLLWISPSINYKIYMWLPWSVPFIYGYLFQKLHSKKGYFWKSSLLLLAVLIGSYLIRTQIHRSTQLFGNKYPPTALYLSYGLLWIHAVYALSQRVPLSKNIQGAVYFFSRYSYQLFFIHYFIITIASYFGVPAMMHWSIFTLAVTLTSFALQQVLMMSQKFATKFL